MSDSAPTPPAAALDYQEVAESDDFRLLQRSHRRFVFPVAVLFLVWYFVYVMLAAYAHEFMATPVFDNVNVGLLLGLGQFVTTFVITMSYVAYANRKLDPLSQKIRSDLEARELDGGTQ
jgi:uncharacterized membrane protein (DUF485 family)